MFHKQVISKWAVACRICPFLQEADLSRCTFEYGRAETVSTVSFSAQLLCFFLFFTFWVTSWKSAREALTSRLLCFTTEFPGSPKGLPPQYFSISSNAVHMSGGT